MDAKTKQKIEKVKEEAQLRAEQLREEGKRKAEEAIAAAERKAKRIADLAEANAAAAIAEAERRAKCEREHRLENHPKKDLLWAKAWERGHAYGLDEVELIYDDLADLLK